MPLTGNNAAVLPLRDAPALLETAVNWFSEKWSIPAEAYRDSMRFCLENPEGVPQWYLIFRPDGRIVAGCGLIENDFHKRPDLAPNVCAVYVEPDVRGRGLARALLDFSRQDAARLGLDRLYLLTDHTQFYERCGWRYLCLAEEEGGGQARIYTAPTRMNRPQP